MEKKSKAEEAPKKPAAEAAVEKPKEATPLEWSKSVKQEASSPAPEKAAAAPKAAADSSTPAKEEDFINFKFQMEAKLRCPRLFLPVVYLGIVTQVKVEDDNLAIRMGFKSFFDSMASASNEFAALIMENIQYQDSSAKTGWLEDWLEALGHVAKREERRYSILKTAP